MEGLTFNSIHHSENINELAKALCEASKKIQPAIKAATNPFYNKNYADLKAIDHVCRIPLAENGLCISQVMDSTNGQLTLITILIHSSGQWLKSYYPITYDKTTPQAIGSGVSYARRYSLAAICSVVTEDDDGEAATKRETETGMRKGEISITATGTGHSEIARKQSEKETMIAKMNNAKSLIDLQSLISQCPEDWKNEKFNSFIKQLEAKFHNDIETELKEQFQAEEITAESLITKHSKTLKPKGATK